MTATVNHFRNGEVIRASTEEWSIKKQLYRNTDTNAFVNLARVLAQRCLESGLCEISCFIEPTTPDGKVALFLKTLEKEGLTLTEPPQFKPARAFDLYRPEKPWEITE